jgi:DNA-binding NarL/FixJ family response regulator
MDGIQAAQALREQQPQTHVVRWTGEGDAQLASAIRKSGAHAGVAKGIRTVELVAISRSVCEACPRPGQDEASGWICSDRTDRAKRRYQQSASA